MRRTYPKPDECASDAVCQCGHLIGDHRATATRPCGHVTDATTGLECRCAAFKLDRKAYAVSRGWEGL